MAGTTPRIDISEAFDIVGTAASGVGSALGSSAPASAPAPFAALGGLDIGTVGLGAGIGAGVAWAAGYKPLTGAGIGALAAAVAPMLGINPIALGPGGV